MVERPIRWLSAVRRGRTPVSRKSLALLALPMFCAVAHAQKPSENSGVPDRPVVSREELQAIPNTREGLADWEIGNLAGWPNDHHPYFAMMKSNKLIWARTPPFEIGRVYEDRYGFSYEITAQSVDKHGRAAWVGRIVTSGGRPKVGTVIYMIGTPALPVPIGEEDLH